MNTEELKPYSLDRISLAQEIRDALKTRGYWVPEQYPYGPDLITAVCKALDARTPSTEGMEKVNKPEVICLCGSTRFVEWFSKMNLHFTLQGKIVLSIGCDTKSDDALGLTEEDKADLNELHLRKIDIADRVFVINIDGYIGDSTRREIEYAENIGKPIGYLEEQFDE